LRDQLIEKVMRRGQRRCDALAVHPLELKLGRYKNAEAVTYGPTGDSAFVTVEKKHAPLLNIDLLSILASARQ
jgi:hypothetical protein